MPSRKKMREWLEHQDKLYFTLDAPEVSDEKYDEVRRKFKKLYPNDPYLQNIGAEVKGKKVALPISMGGFDQKPASAIDKWVREFRKKYGDLTVYILPKLDGISILLQYRNGKLYKVYTRGRKKPGDKVGTGKPVLLQALKIQGVPKTIKYTGELFIRGEAICHNKIFAAIKDKEFEGSPKGGYKHARTFVSGMFNRDELLPIHEKLLRKITFVAFAVVVKGKVLSKWRQLCYLANNGFVSITNPGALNKEILKFERKFELERSNATLPIPGPMPYVVPYDMKKIEGDWLMAILDEYRDKIDIHQDGLVIEIDNPKVRALGDDGNYPKYAVKVKPERANQVSAVGEIAKIEWGFTSRRIYTPVAILKAPVDLEGIKVSRFYLHTAEKIKKLGITIGCKVKCVRAGSVIPHIEEVIK